MNLKNVLTLAFGVALLGSTSAVRAADAVLVEKSGTVTAILPDGSTKDLSQGDAIPEGSTVKTSADAVANIMPAAGEIATLEANTTVKLEKIRISRDSSGMVTKQEVLLDLTSGDLVATLDPSKRAIDDFKIHTAMGTAAARGTAVSVSVTDNGFTVAATADSVVFTTATGDTYTVAAGQIILTPKGGVPQAPVSLASAAANNPVIAALISTAISAVSNVVEKNQGGLSSASAINLITQVVGVASAAEPASAAAFAKIAALAVAAPGSATAAVGTQAAAAVAAAAAAASPSEAVQIAVGVTETVTAIAGVKAISSAGTAIAGEVAAAVASASNTGVAGIAESIADVTGASASSITTAASNPSSSNTQTSSVPSTATVIQQVNLVVSPVVTKGVSPAN